MQLRSGDWLRELTAWHFGLQRAVAKRDGRPSEHVFFAAIAAGDGDLGSQSKLSVIFHHLRQVSCRIS
jgi:hypothetical protein